MKESRGFESDVRVGCVTLITAPDDSGWLTERNVSSQLGVCDPKEKDVAYSVRGISVAVFAALLAALAIPTVAAPAPSACSIMTKAEVKPFSTNRLFDQFPPEEMTEGRGTSCGYAGVYIQLDVIPFSTIESMSREKGQNIQAVQGVGDAAYVRDNRGMYAELYARVGQRVFTVQLDIGPQETFASVRPRLIQMGTAMAAKLR